MADSLLEAFKKARIVAADDVLQIEEEKRWKIVQTEKGRKAAAKLRAVEDAERLHNSERYAKKAAKEGTRAVSNAGSKEYLRRFRR